MSVEPSQQKGTDLDAIKAANDCYIVLRRHLKKALTNREKEIFLSGIEIYDEMSIKFDFTTSIRHKKQLSSSLLPLVLSVLGLETKCSINYF